MRSIRSYLLTRLVGGAALVLAGAGLAAYVAVARALEEQLDRNLSDRVQGLASLLFQVGEHVEFEFSGELMPEYEREEQPAYFELRFADGRLLERSETLRGDDLAARGPVGSEPIHWNAGLPDGRPGRFVARQVVVHHVYPEEGPERPPAATLRVVLAHARGPLLAAQRRVAWICALASLILASLVAVLSWRAVDRSLEPTGRLAGAVAALRPDALPPTLDAGSLPLELQPVASKVDALISRVESALERERRTAADIAHELRTPISELVTTAEVALRGDQDGVVSRDALRAVRDIAWRMGGATSTLLKLARLDMGSESFEHVPVDLGSVVTAELRFLASVARERDLAVSCNVAAGSAVEGDPEVLRIVVSNLLGNAVQHAPPGSTVACGLARAEQGWSLEVVNDAGDLQPGDLAALCEPFWRGDDSRGDRQRAGLGLALSHALALRADLRLEFSLVGGRLRAALSGGQPSDTPTPRNGSSS